MRHLRQVIALLFALAAARVVWLAISYFLDGRLGRHRVETAWLIVVALGFAMVLLSGTPLAPQGEVKARSSCYQSAIPGAVGIAVALILYWPALWIGLLSDDFVLLAWSSVEIVSLGAWELYRPVPLLAWKVLFPFGGAVALHAVNILLHGLNASLVSRLALRVGHTSLMSAVAGLVFLTFPAAVEPVVWNSGIFDVAMVTFGLLYFHACVSSRGGAWAPVFLLVALLTKETAVALPLLAAILRLRVPIPARTLIASAAITAAYVGVRVVSGATVGNREPISLQYAIKELVIRPFASLGVPWTAAELAAQPIVLGVVPTGILIMLIWLYCMRPTVGAGPALGAAMVVGGALPLWQLFFVGENLEGSRYLYLPLVGWSLLLADLMAHQYSWRRYLCSAGAMVVITIAGMWGVRQHLMAWEEAAQMRDVVLQSATEQLARSSCSEVVFENIPDSVNGAYVFRNGLSEALRHRNPIGDSPGGLCMFEWRNGQWRRIE